MRCMQFYERQNIDRTTISPPSIIKYTIIRHIQYHHRLYYNMLLHKPLIYMVMPLTKSALWWSNAHFTLSKETEKQLHSSPLQQSMKPNNIKKVSSQCWCPIGTTIISCRHISTSAAAAYCIVFESQVVIFCCFGVPQTYRVQYVRVTNIIEPTTIPSYPKSNHPGPYSYSHNISNVEIKWNSRDLLDQQYHIGWYWQLCNQTKRTTHNQQ